MDTTKMRHPLAILGFPQLRRKAEPPQSLPKFIPGSCKAPEQACGDAVKGWSIFSSLYSNPLQLKAISSLICFILCKDPSSH